MMARKQKMEFYKSVIYLCDYTYTSHEAYQGHKSKRYKDPGTINKCDQCNKHFKLKYYLNLNVKECHEKSTFKCVEDGCDATYLSHEGLRDHKNTVDHSFEELGEIVGRLALIF